MVADVPPTVLMLIEPLAASTGRLNAPPTITRFRVTDHCPAVIAVCARPLAI